MWTNFDGGNEGEELRVAREGHVFDHRGSDTALDEELGSKSKF